MNKFFLIFIIFFINNSVQSSDLFDTSFHNIEFISSDIKNDKIIKINEIKFKSLLDILKKTLDKEGFIEVESYLTEDLINTFIKNIIINDERIINDKYISKIKINFDKKKIIQFFRLKKIPYVEYYPKKFLLIIYEQGELYDNLFTKNNSFYSYFLKYKYKYNYFKIPNLDINDRYILNKKNIINLDTKKIKNFAKKYNLNNIIVVYANIEKTKVNYDLILFSNEKNIKKTLNYNDYEFEIFFKKLEYETLNYWKKLNHIQNDVINSIKCKLNYFNILELKEIKNNLSNVSIIYNLNVKSLSFKSIEYEINYYGNLEILINILKKNQLQIKYKNEICLIGLKQ